MSKLIDRSNSNLISKWWWTIDRTLLFLLIILITLGCVMMLAGSPLVAFKLKLPAWYFVTRHILWALIGIFIIVGISMLEKPALWKYCKILFFIIFLLTLSTLFIGQEIKGAKRWILIAGNSLQPSELIKPFFAILNAYLLAKVNKNFICYYKILAIILYLATVSILILQPDLGMAVIITCTWLAQCFIAGLPLIILGILIGCACVALMGSYFILPHVAARINKFLYSEGDHYQIDRAIEAFINGSWWGVGPGEGTVKRYIPDVQADFIFAVLGEEFGLVACIVVICIFLLIIKRSKQLIHNLQDWFFYIASYGIFIAFILQTLVNVGSSLGMLPTKGMTLPFISYGGSSLLGVSLAMGLFLCLTRENVKNL